MSAAIVIRGGTVIDPANALHAQRDVLVRDGKIAAVAEALPNETLAGATVFDAANYLVFPGLIDMHVHLREPGYEYRETIETGTRAAVAGGFTAVACMANTKPVNDSAAVTEYIRDRAQAAGLARVYPIGAVSKDLRGEELAEIGEMREAGIVAVSDDGMPIMNGGLMRRALEYTAMFGLPVIVHEEDRSIAADGVMHEGAMSLRLGLKGVPAAAEEAMIARDLSLLERTGGRLHIAHVSSAGAVALLRAAKERGLPVTAEAAPHHFTLTDAAVEGYNTHAKMNPPLRSRQDVEAIRQALADGTIDVIASDHAPHHRDEKELEFDRALNGVVGLETTLALALRLADESRIPLSRLVAAMSLNPARILNLPLGTLSLGAEADITVIDPARPWVVRPERFQSKGRSTPFEGMELRGQTVLSMVAGRIVWRAATSEAA